MKTSDIINGLLARVPEWVQDKESASPRLECPECGELLEDGHKEGCALDALIQGAKEYLRIMNGAQK